MGAKLVGDVEGNRRRARIAFHGVGTNSERSSNREGSQAGRTRYRNVAGIGKWNPDGRLNPALT
jgi:hypothetical protein